MRTFDSPPYAPMLMESTRAIGYTIEAAVADIIDNSITARARNISIKFMTLDEPYISILDDGLGMTFNDLKDAMNYGSCDPSEERDEADLGRYGLGLKTASLSQCRQLTVASLTDGQISVFCWDLDFIRTQGGKWTLQCFDENEINNLPQIDDLKKQGSGSLVVWQKLDRVCVGAANIHRAITSKVDDVRSHLELTFHRYLAGETDIKKVSIKINNKEIKSNDPFLLQKSTVITTETINVNYYSAGEKRNASVKVTPYILPHLSQMENEEIDKLGGVDGLIKNQGFYIYRNKRLLMCATWFRLARKTDVTKLCRVKVDLPNSLDSEWSLDIKKSTAHPPEVVVQSLQRIVGQILGNSRRVYSFRGRKEIGTEKEKLWQPENTRNGKLFVINREHPIIKKQLENVSKQNSFLALLELIESEIPINQIISDSENDKKFAMDYEEEKYQKVKSAFRDMLLSYPEKKRKEMFDILRNVSPFDDFEFDIESITGERNE